MIRVVGIQSCPKGKHGIEPTAGFTFLRGSFKKMKQPWPDIRRITGAIICSGYTYFFGFGFEKLQCRFTIIFYDPVEYRIFKTVF